LGSFEIPAGVKDPILIFTGPIEEFDAFYELSNGDKFNFPDAKEAVLFSLQLIWALDIQYPDIANQVWIFIQRILFNEKYVSDKLSSHLRKLINNSDLE